jgi:hypothetical protein
MTLQRGEAGVVSMDCCPGFGIVIAVVMVMGLQH